MNEKMGAQWSQNISYKKHTVPESSTFRYDVIRKKTYTYKITIHLKLNKSDKTCGFFRKPNFQLKKGSWHWRICPCCSLKSPGQPFPTTSIEIQNRHRAGQNLAGWRLMVEEPIWPSNMISRSHKKSHEITGRRKSKFFPRFLPPLALDFLWMWSSFDIIWTHPAVAGMPSGIMGPLKGCLHRNWSWMTSWMTQLTILVWHLAVGAGNLISTPICLWASVNWDWLHDTFVKVNHLSSSPI